MAKLERWVAKRERWVAKKGEWEVKRGRWVAKLEARLHATAALLAQIQTSLKNIKIGGYKQRSGQPTLARQKIEEKMFLFDFTHQLGHN